MLCTEGLDNKKKVNKKWYIPIATKVSEVSSDGLLFRKRCKCISHD